MWVEGGGEGMWLWAEASGQRGVGCGQRGMDKGVQAGVLYAAACPTLTTLPHCPQEQGGDGAPTDIKPILYALCMPACYCCLLDDLIAD